MINAVLITSKTNAAVKRAAQLCCSAKFRRQSGQFIIEGLRLCGDAFATGIEIVTLMMTSAAYEKNSSLLDKMAQSSKECYFISEDIAKKLSDTVNPQGIFCICSAFYQREIQIEKSGRYILLENVADPSNVGAIIRTAEALGIDGAVLSKGSCDLLNPKTLRASMGSVFRLPIAVVDDMASLVKGLTEQGFLTAASVPDLSAVSISELPLNRGCAVVIGNEANGISDRLKALCSTLTTIPMQGRAESLNAATAASIIMWEMMR